MSFVETLAAVLTVGSGMIISAAITASAILFLVDRTQKADAVRRNYPLIGRFRYLFTTLGEFFRQYFFAMDREELPFNRAQREWVNRASRGKNNTIAFGSTRNLSAPGTSIFINAPYPPLDEQAAKTVPLTIGVDCKHPYHAPAFFNISGMSYGAISRPAVLALSQGAAKAGIWLNTGEGGMSKWHLEGGCDLVFQIGTAKYGVRDKNGNLSDEKLREIASLPQVKMFEIKLAQGAKPGKGGILPGAKIDAEVAAARGITEGKDSHSPNRHPDISCDDELINMIQRVRSVSGKPVGFKTVLGDFEAFEMLLDRIVELGLDSAPDFISIDGGDGGTGAAPMPLMDLVGLPLSIALPKVSDLLHERNLRSRVRLIASGRLINPSEVAWAIAAGADFVVSARGFMFSLGCIQALKCNKNTCPTGITSHDPRFQKGLDPELKSDRVASYVRSVVEEVEIIAHSVGVREPREIRRRHVQIILPDGRTQRMDNFFPRHGPSKDQGTTESKSSSEIPQTL